VLNGEPFIEYHLELFKQLPFKWHWHIIEGVAELKNDTAWSVANGGKIADSFHKNGLSIDGTTEYLDKIKKEYPDKITIYRKKDGFWNGKIEMVNAPLRNIKENCILLEVDSDELWTFEQIITLRKLFIENPTKTAAYFWCHFYVGETIITTLKNNYSKSPSYEWIRAWNYRPGDQWLTHEPPALCRKFENNNWNDLAKVNPFYHNETESHGLIFHHYAYVLEEQLKFKEIYYGYKNALSYWQNLNSQKKYPVKLRKFFPWVSDNQEVDEINKFGIKSIAYKSANIWKYNYYIPNENSNIILDNNFQLQNNIDRKKASKKIIIDGVIFQLQRHKPAGISRVWISLLSELGKTDLAESIIILDRDRTAPIITGITNVPVSGFLGYEKIEADSIYLQDICDKYNAGIFISTYYTYPKSTKTIMMVHDLIPEVYEWKGIEWDTKKKCIELADSFLSVSKSTAKDLKRYYQLGKKEINIIPNAVSDIFKENTKEQIDFFKIKYGIKKPYFIVSGTRTYHKNIIQFVKAFNSLKNKNNFEILFTGGPPDIEKEFLPYLKNVKYQVVYLSDKELSVAYSAAVALVYPSKYEGFGLPILEAMKAGCPVITCKNSSLSEVAEEAAIYIKEDDIGSLTLALKSVQSKQNRSKLIKKGFEQAKKFNWSISASKLYEVLSKELIKDKNKIKIRDTKLDEHNSLYYSILSQYELSTALNGLFNLLNTNESLSEKDLYAAEDNLVRAFDDSSILNKLYAVAEKYQDPLLLYIKSLFLEREKEINDTYKCLVSLIKNGFPNWWIVYKVALLANKFNNSKEAIRLLKLVKETKPNIEFIDYKLSEVESATENVKVTAIVSTYNSSKFIKGCLEDLVNQTLYKKDELEIIIINSGSEENEEEIVNEFIKNHKNIRYYKTEKESIYKAWNRAIKLAKGKYITNANTDDRHRNDALEKMLSVFENDETVDIVYANSLKTVTPNDLFHSQTPKSEIKWSQFDKDLILFGCFIGPHPMWKMDLHKRFGLFSEELDVVGDYEFWLRISRESKFHHINEALGLYYYNNKSAEHRNQSLTNDENTDVQKIYLSKYIQSFEDVNRIEKKILQLVNNNKENEYYKIVSELLTFRKEELYHENKFFAEIEKLIKSESIESKSLMFPLQSITKNYKGLLRNEKLNFLIDLFTTLEDTNFEINENVQKLLIENNDFYHNTFIKEFIKSKVRNENRESLNDALEIISNHINEKEYEKSIEYLNNLLNSVNNLSDEYRAELIDMIGNIYLVQGNIEQANKFFEKELQINPSSSRACFGLAETFYIAELYEQAKAMYEWAIKNGKNDEITWNKLRIVNKELNLDENDNSLDLVNIQELLQRAEEFINNDDFENALDILDKILGTDENNIDALNDLSVIFILQNEIESALNVINKVIDLDSENEIAKNNLQVLENKIKASAVN
jgi:glycosyltransferase involved in cell wall biosynthesis